VIILINSKEEGFFEKERVAELVKEVILCNRMIHYRVESSPPFVPILSPIIRNKRLCENLVYVQYTK
jgi:hypothetical protein